MLFIFMYYFLSQVETVGDKYMAVSGLPEPCESHAKCIARLALDIMDLSKEVSTAEGDPIVSMDSNKIVNLNVQKCKQFCLT